MKKQILTLLLFGLIVFNCVAQDQTPIVVNVNDNLVLSYAGAFVKQKATCISYTPVISSTKDFSITVIITNYISNSGAYGITIAQDIANKLAATTISQDQANQLLLQYGDRQITYTTIGQCTDASGNYVACTGSNPEILYWQTFKLNQIPGMAATTALQGAADSQYLIVKAIITKLDSRKKW